MPQHSYSAADIDSLSKWFAGTQDKTEVISPVIDKNAVSELNTKIDELKKDQNKIPTFETLYDEQKEKAKSNLQEDGKEPHIYKSCSMLLTPNFDEELKTAITGNPVSGDILKATTLDSKYSAAINNSLFKKLNEELEKPSSISEISVGGSSPMQKEAATSTLRRPALTKGDCELMLQLAKCEESLPQEGEITIAGNKLRVNFTPNGKLWSIDNAITDAQKQLRELEVILEPNSELPTEIMESNGTQTTQFKDVAKIIENKHIQEKLLNALLLYKEIKQMLEPLVLNKLKHNVLEQQHKKLTEDHAKLANAFNLKPDVFQLQACTLFGENIRDKAKTYDPHLLPDGSHCYAARDAEGRLLGLAMPKTAWFEAHSFEKWNNLVLAAKKLGLNKATIHCDNSSEAAAMFVSAAANGINVSVKRQVDSYEDRADNWNNDEKFFKQIDSKVPSAMQDLCKVYEKKLDEHQSEESKTALKALIDGIKISTFSSRSDVNAFFNKYKPEASIVSSLLTGVKEETPKDAHENEFETKRDPASMPAMRS